MKQRSFMVAAFLGAMFVLALASSGSAASGRLSPSSHRLDCAKQPVSAGPVYCGAVSFTNGGSATITVGYYVLGDTTEFSYSPNGCDDGQQLTAGETCQVDFWFNPTSTGHKSITFVELDNTDSTSTKVRIVGTGT